MALPRFSGEASLYKTNAFYRGHASVPQGPPPSGLVVPAYRPLPVTQADCDYCNEGCDNGYEGCNALLTPLTFACPFFPPACAALAAGQLVCDGEYAGCRSYCLLGHCCPKVCGFPDPLHPGLGCCESGEHCVDENDPNSRSGCCPSDRSVCGGKCCNSGEVCVGDFCCPADATTVCNGVCCTGSCTPGGECCPSPSHVCGNDCCPPFNKCCNGQCCGAYQQCDPTLGICTNPPPPPPASCPPGSAPCGIPDNTGVIRTCCPPGLMCCNYTPEFGPECKTSCLH